jgi:hypothetical protein
MLQNSQSLWEKTNVQNLFRYRPSGTYFARFKIGDKPIRQSLETTVFSVAKQRLPEKMREYRSRHESAKAFADGKMTVGDAAQVYLLKVRASASLKPRSKDYREMILGFIERSWPSEPAPPPRMQPTKLRSTATTSKSTPRSTPTFKRIPRNGHTSKDYRANAWSGCLSCRMSTRSSAAHEFAQV